MGSYVSTERRDAVALVTIDNPPMNALSSALLDELESELDALDGDDDVRAIVLRGGGERAFVAGADIKEFPSLRESAGEGGSARGIQKLGHRMDAARTPFVAAIRGYCLGGGLELAMCCDVRVCAIDATLGQRIVEILAAREDADVRNHPRVVGAPAVHVDVDVVRPAEVGVGHVERTMLVRVQLEILAVHGDADLHRRLARVDRELALALDRIGIEVRGV